MRSAAKKNLAPLAGPLRNAAAVKKSTPWLTLSKRGSGKHLSKEDVTFVFRNLATLCGNGVSLPKALGALADERGMERRRGALLDIRKRIESGDTFSNALAKCGSSFDNVTLGQVRVGERAGTLPETLAQISEQREKAGRLQQDIIKKLAYPVTLATVGSGVVAFLLGYVVPVFEETYRSARVPLPGITQLMVQIGAFAHGYWWVVLLTLVGAPMLIHQLRKNQAFALRMDTQLLRVPLIGPWLRDIALLQLVEVLGSLMEAGFTLAEALKEAGDSIGNRAMKIAVTDLRQAVQRGEKFSREVERHSGLFPPMVSQLVIVGEQTGKLTRSTQHIRAHLEEEVKRKSDIAIGVIEPVLTISMAAAVAVILLAIYLPMFDMVNTVG